MWGIEILKEARQNGDFVEVKVRRSYLKSDLRALLRGGRWWWVVDGGGVIMGVGGNS